MEITEIVIPFQVVEIVYYSTVWIVACCAGIARSLRSNTRFVCRDFISVGLCSGFLGFAVVSLRDFAIGGFGGSEWGGVGIAALIGLAGQEQEQIIRALWKVMLRKIGVGEDAFAADKKAEKDIRSADHDSNRNSGNSSPN